MAHSSAPVYPSASARRLWPTAFILTLVTLTVPVLILALGGLSASSASAGGLASSAIVVALACGVAGLLVFVLLARLRTQHGAAESEAARLRGELREKEAEAARREAHWHAYVKGRIELVREEIEYVVKSRLPAALTGAEIPLALHIGDQLGDGVAEVLDHLLAEVAEAADDREESHRLALVELASRVQTSAHRIQAAAMGLADRYPLDSDLLAATMQVDHAATQQARHAQSLKVLCNEWPGQQWQKPLALVDVVRAASGRIVAFKRVEVTGDPDVGVTPSVVEPLIHLMAELLANATEYSPPKTVVPVTVRTVQRGAVIEVDDGGLGLDEYRLSDLREVVSGRRLLGVGDVGEIPQTGFAVVGRFAHRHGFNVDLGPSPYGGVRAVVLVPVEILETLDPAGLPLSRRSAGPRSFAVARTRESGVAGPVTSEPTTHHRPVPEPLAPAPSFHELSAPLPAVPAEAGSPGPGSGPGHGPVIPAQLMVDAAPDLPVPDLPGPGFLGPETARPTTARPETGFREAPPRQVPSREGTGWETPLRENPFPDTAVAEAHRRQYGLAAAQNGSVPAIGGGGPAERRLPRRRSRRDAYVPGSGTVPTASAPPGTPEEAGDWMEQFFEGGRSFSEQAGAALAEHPGPAATSDAPTTSQARGNPESPEGRM